MYVTGNTTKNTGVQVSRNLIVTEKCPNLDFRYGPYRSVEEAFDAIESVYRAVGLTVGILQEDGEIVEYWFKSNTKNISDLVPKISEGEDLYSPSESIPDDATSTVSVSKSELQGQTISQILDKILFKDTPAFVTDNASRCTLSAVSSTKEVGSNHSSSDYKTTVGTASYGYPSGTQSWTAGSVSVGNNTKIKLGSANTGTCIFTLTGIPTLKSSYGVTPSSQPSYQKTITKTATITGFYNCGFSYSSESSTAWNNFSITALGDKVISTTSQSTEYIWVALPETLKITKVKVKHPLNDSYVDFDGVLEKGQSSVQASGISSNYRFYIWKISKAALNSDGSVTKNSQPMQITIANN